MGQEITTGQVQETSSERRYRFLRLLPRNADTSDISLLKRNLEKLGETEKKMKKVVIFGTGSYNPAHNMHVKMFSFAKKEMEKRNFVVVGGFLSPAHDTYVENKLDYQYIPGEHRCNILKKIVKNQELNDWLTVDKAEFMHHRIVYISYSLFSMREYCEKELGRELLENVSFMYLCGKDLFLKAQGFVHLQVEGHGVIVLDRAGVGSSNWKIECQEHLCFIPSLEKESSSHMNMSSTELRRRILNDENVEESFLCKEALEYIQENGLMRNPDEDEDGDEKMGEDDQSKSGKNNDEIKEEEDEDQPKSEAEEEEEN